MSGKSTNIFRWIFSTFPLESLLKKTIFSSNIICRIFGWIDTVSLAILETIWILTLFRFDSVSRKIKRVKFQNYIHNIPDNSKERQSMIIRDFLTFIASTKNSSTQLVDRYDFFILNSLFQFIPSSNKRCLTCELTLLIESS